MFLNKSFDCGQCEPFSCGKNLFWVTSNKYGRGEQSPNENPSIQHSCCAHQWWIKHVILAFCNIYSINCFIVQTNSTVVKSPQVTQTYLQQSNLWIDLLYPEGTENAMKRFLWKKFRSRSTFIRHFVVVKICSEQAVTTRTQRLTKGLSYMFDDRWDVSQTWTNLSFN